MSLLLTPEYSAIKHNKSTRESDQMKEWRNQVLQQEIETSDYISLTLKATQTVRERINSQIVKSRKMIEEAKKFTERKIRPSIYVSKDRLSKSPVKHD